MGVGVRVVPVTPDLSDLLPAEVKQMFLQEKRTIGEDFSDELGPGRSR